MMINTFTSKQLSLQLNKFEKYPQHNPGGAHKWKAGRYLWCPRNFSEYKGKLYSTGVSWS
jgi:hypothetical protein